MKSKVKSQKSKVKKGKTVKLKTKRPVRKMAFLKSDLKRFKQLLLQAREKVVGEIENITKNTLKTSQREAAGDLSGYTLHMADMATDHYDREFSLEIATNEQRVVYQIDEALKRIEDGTYGLCVTCDRRIAKKRLMAVPHAGCCVECQEKEELMQKRGV